jgi:hypothetical protein
VAIDVKPGDRIRRTQLHDQYGGRRQGGISPSRVTPNVFVVTAPERGSTFGYVYDGRSDDGFFHYTGEGQVGDQQMTQGNRAIRDHEREERELHLLEAHGTELEYIGQFRYYDDYQADAPQVDPDEPERKVIVFRLEQLSGTDIGPTRARLDRFGDDQVKEVPVEQFLTESMLIDGEREPYEAERREQQLVWTLANQLEQMGHETCRLQFRPDGEAAPLFCDLYDKTTSTLYEAKGTVTRPAMRMAIGQLADYSRLVSSPTQRVVLLPEQPRDDLLKLAASQEIEVVWRTQDGSITPTPTRTRNGR